MSWSYRVLTLKCFHCLIYFVAQQSVEKELARLEADRNLCLSNMGEAAEHDKKHALFEEKKSRETKLLFRISQLMDDNRNQFGL